MMHDASVQWQGGTKKGSFLTLWSKTKKASPHAVQCLWPRLRVHCPPHRPLWPHGAFIYLSPIRKARWHLQIGHVYRCCFRPHFCVSPFLSFLFPSFRSLWLFFSVSESLSWFVSFNIYFLPISNQISPLFFLCYVLFLFFFNLFISFHLCLYSLTLLLSLFLSAIAVLSQTQNCCWPTTIYLHLTNSELISNAGYISSLKMICTFRSIFINILIQHKYV